MRDKKQILHELDEAIDKMDMETVNASLEQLSHVENIPDIAEDANLFAARIEMISKENRTMKHPKNVFKLTLAATIALALGLTVYAVANPQTFAFLSGDRFVTMRTNQSMTSAEAQDMVREAQEVEKNAPARSEEDIAALTPESMTFETPEQAEKELDMRLVLPSAFPQMTLDSISGQTMYGESGYKSSTMWTEYSDTADRRLGVTIVREQIPTGEEITSFTQHDIDKGSLGSYKSKSGLTFTTLTESDESGEKQAHIATTTVGEYEYTLVFFGFEESERQAILDSTDLSAYQK